jgi:hypothetical protein
MHTEKESQMPETLTLKHALLLEWIVLGAAISALGEVNPISSLNTTAHMTYRRGKTSA